MLNGLLEEEWRVRLDAKDLNKFLINNNITPSERPFLSESKYLYDLDKKRKEKEGFKVLYERFGAAFLQKEMIEIAKQELEYEKKKEENEQNIWPILKRLGSNLKLKK